MRAWTADSVERTLREVSQLRALALRLGRMPTPRRQRLAEEFGEFLRGATSTCSPQALAQGLETLWGQGKIEEIRSVSGRFPGPWTLEAATFRELADAALERRAAAD